MSWLLLACTEKGPPATGDSASVSDPQGSFAARTLALGSYHGCALVDGEVSCWGDDTYGQLAAPAEDFVSISSDVLHSCGLTSDERASCWGLDTAGQCDAPGTSFMDVDAGTSASCPRDNAPTTTNPVNGLRR